MGTKILSRIEGPLRFIPIIAGILTILFFADKGWNWAANNYDFLKSQGAEKVTYILNATVCLIVILLWYAKGRHKDGIQYFTLPWIGFWGGLLIYYGCNIFFKGKMDLQLELFLNNANTIFIFLLYTLLSYPKGKNESGVEVIVPTIFGSFIIFLLIVFFTHFMPMYGKIISGIFAFFGFALLSSRLESYFPKHSLVIIFLFAYAAVQIMWIPKNIEFAYPESDEVFTVSKAAVFFMALLGKVFLGYLITWEYKQISEKATRYFEIKHEEKTSPNNK